VQINQTLVDSHFESIKGLRTVTTRRLTSGDTEDLGRETNGTLDLELLILGTLNKIRRDYLELGVSIRCIKEEVTRSNLPFSKFLTLREVKVIRIR
jgi:hypothetical protein